MAAYGTVLSADADPSRMAARRELARYFGDPVMTKVSQDGGQATYAARFRLQIGGEERYLFALQAGDSNVTGSKFPLSLVTWDVLQTRGLPDGSDVPCDLFTHVPKNVLPYTCRGQLKVRSDDLTEYTFSNFYCGVEVAILVKEGGTKYDHPNSGSLCSALETYRTIVRLRDPVQTDLK